VRDFELLLKAVADPTRTRILKLLERGGLCVCQVQAVLGLAASTVSRHLTLLKHTGLVQDRRRGKWVEYVLATSPAGPFVEPVLALLHGPLDHAPEVVADRRRLREVRKIPLDEICAVVPRPTPRRRRHGPRERRHD